MTTAAAMHTPPAAVGAQIHAIPQTLSPPSSPQLHHPNDGMNWNNDAVPPEVVEKKKRKYSAKQFQWTLKMWEHARKDIERRSSVSSGSSMDSETPTDSAAAAGPADKPRRASNAN